ncbi:MAG: SH3 domain-containing protein [Deltaproteobacteria bacterium]|nr:SH3 domain-containing protein [Deltaproteobacteria bacterium]
MGRIVVFGLLALALHAIAAAAADTSVAVVSGAELLYVRRGPGTNFPAFATIERGERVEVERLEGVWAQVRLASGQNGYVHSTFLAFPGEKGATVMVLATPTAPAATLTRTQVTRTSSPAPTPSPTVTPTVVYEPTATPTPPAAALSPDAAGDSDEVKALRREVERLTTTVDTLHKRLGDWQAQPNTSAATGEHPWRTPTITVLVLIALLVGWVAGGAYGRHSERQRRNRIRF